MIAAEVHSLSFSYDAGVTWALDGIDLTIERGSRVAIVGTNGSGKSTLARVLAGLSAPDSGQVNLMGLNVFHDGTADADAYRTARRVIGAVFQQPEDQIVTTVVEDDVAFGPENLGITPNEIAKRIETSLEQVSMQDARSLDPTHMSGGQQQRIAIAGILAMHPEMIVFDEPTAMLDPQARTQVMQVMAALEKQGVTLIHVTHRFEESIDAQRIITMDQGCIRYDETTEEYVNRVGMPEQHCDTPTQNSSYGDIALKVDNVSLLRSQDMQPVVHPVSFQVRFGQILAIMGENGVGKSTLARMIAAFETPTTGSITVAGIPVAQNDVRGNHSRKATRSARKSLRQVLGFVMQHPERQLFAPTVLEDVAYAPLNQGLSKDEALKRAQETLQLLHIEHLQERNVFELSGGQQRMVAIAGVLAAQPTVLVLDEPTSSLDEIASARIESMLLELAQQGLAIVVITHDIDQATRLTNTALVLSHNNAARMVQCQELSTLLRNHQSYLDTNVESDITNDDAVTKSIDGNNSGNIPEHKRKYNRLKSSVQTSRSNLKDQSTKSAKRIRTDRKTSFPSWHTFLRTIDPRVFIVTMFVTMCMCFTITQPLQLAIACVFVGIVLALSKVRMGLLFRSLAPLMSMIAIFGVLNIAFTHEGTALVSLGVLRVTDYGILTAVIYTARFILAIVMGGLIIEITTPTSLTDSLHSLLSPLRRFGVHTQEIALVLSLALRFLPTLTSEARSIVQAQAARGGDIETGSLFRRIHALGAIIVPMIHASLRHADNLALALDARSYEQSIARTHWRSYHISAHDYVWSVICLSYCAIEVVMLFV